MTNRLLKGLAVAAGTGLAVGFTSGRARAGAIRYRAGRLNGRANAAPAEFAAKNYPNGTPSNGTPLNNASADSAPEEFLDIEPLLDRIERLEVRVDEISQQASAEHVAGPSVASVSPASNNATDSALASYAESIADLERRVEQNTRELDLLRRSIAEAEARMTESVTSVERRLEQTRRELPAIIEPLVTARIGDLQTRFTAEIEKSHRRTLEVFERALDEKISSRIGAIEKAIADQAGSIEALSTRSAETDNNLQRLVTAIERLCERAQLFPSAAEQQPTRTAFALQLNDAMQGNPAVPVLRTEEPATPEVPAPAFTVLGGKPQPRPKKSRFLFRNLVVAGFGLLASRFLR
jgi:uncharacterized coiled-coil protein SlyX